MKQSIKIMILIPLSKKVDSMFVIHSQLYGNIYVMFIGITGQVLFFQAL